MQKYTIHCGPTAILLGEIGITAIQGVSLVVTFLTHDLDLWNGTSGEKLQCWPFGLGHHVGKHRPISGKCKNQCVRKFGCVLTFFLTIEEVGGLRGGGGVPVV